MRQSEGALYPWERTICVLFPWPSDQTNIKDFHRCFRFGSSHAPPWGSSPAGSDSWDGDAATSSTLAKTEAAAILLNLLAQCWLCDLNQSKWAGLTRPLLYLNCFGQSCLISAVIGRRELSRAWRERAITSRWGRAPVVTCTDICAWCLTETEHGSAGGPCLGGGHSVWLVRHLGESVNKSVWEISV